MIFPCSSLHNSTRRNPVPSRAEAQWQIYSAQTAAFMVLLRDHDIPIIEVLKRISADDYFDHDAHFNPDGAQRTAEAIVASFGM